MKFWKILVMMCIINLFFHNLQAAGQAKKFKVIINSSIPMNTISKKDLSKIFLKKITRWEYNGELIRPVDLINESIVRKYFSQYIHSKSISAVKAYWQQQIFSGRKIPPLEKSSDSEIIEYVEKMPCAIGYVSYSVDLSQYNVKQVEVVEKPEAAHE